MSLQKFTKDDDFRFSEKSINLNAKKAPLTDAFILDVMRKPTGNIPVFNYGDFFKGLFFDIRCCIYVGKLSNKYFPDKICYRLYKMMEIYYGSSIFSMLSIKKIPRIEWKTINGFDQILHIFCFLSLLRRVIMSSASLTKFCYNDVSILDEVVDDKIFCQEFINFYHSIKVKVEHLISNSAEHIYKMELNKDGSITPNKKNCIKILKIFYLHFANLVYDGLSKEEKQQLYSIFVRRFNIKTMQSDEGFKISWALKQHSDGTFFVDNSLSKSECWLDRILDSIVIKPNTKYECLIPDVLRSFKQYHALKEQFKNSQNKKRFKNDHKKELDEIKESIFTCRIITYSSEGEYLRIPIVYLVNLQLDGSAMCKTTDFHYIFEDNSKLVKLELEYLYINMVVAKTLATSFKQIYCETGDRDEFYDARLNLAMCLSCKDFFPPFYDHKKTMTNLLNISLSFFFSQPQLSIYSPILLSFLEIINRNFWSPDNIEGHYNFSLKGDSADTNTKENSGRNQYNFKFPLKVLFNKKPVYEEAFSVISKPTYIRELLINNKDSFLDINNIILLACYDEALAEECYSNYKNINIINNAYECTEIQKYFIAFNEYPVGHFNKSYQSIICKFMNNETSRTDCFGRNNLMALLIHDLRMYSSDQVSSFSIFDHWSKFREDNIERANSTRKIISHLIKGKNLSFIHNFFGQRRESDLFGVNSFFYACKSNCIEYLQYFEDEIDLLYVDVRYWGLINYAISNGPEFDDMLYYVIKLYKKNGLWGENLPIVQAMKVPDSFIEHIDKNKKNKRYRKIVKSILTNMNLKFTLKYNFYF